MTARRLVNLCAVKAPVLRWVLRDGLLPRRRLV